MLVWVHLEKIPPEGRCISLEQAAATFALGGADLIKGCGCEQILLHDPILEGQ
ncbi:MAG: hypothetical protein JRD03_07735 [Deltaproteobacteria bacterium]|nr:hypothetical protein [Deltaproteobacteria bacterium]